MTKTMKIRELLTKDIDIDCYDDIDESIGIAFCGPQNLTEEGEKRFEKILNCNCEVDEENCCCILLLDEISNTFPQALPRAKTLFYGAAGYISEEKHKRYFVDSLFHSVN